MVKILVTGSEGRFAKILKKIPSKHDFIFKSKKELNILSSKSILKNLKKFKPKYILHLAGLSRPMNIHDKNIVKSINLNIIGREDYPNASRLLLEAFEMGFVVLLNFS